MEKGGDLKKKHKMWLATSRRYRDLPLELGVDIVIINNYSFIDRGIMSHVLLFSLSHISKRPHVGHWGQISNVEPWW